MDETRADEVAVDRETHGRDWWRLVAGVLLLIAVAGLAVMTGGQADGSVQAVTVVASLLALLAWLRRRH